MPLKCHLTANRQQPTANSQEPTVTATDRHLLTPQVSTVGWSKTVICSNLKKQMLKLNICLFHKIFVVHNFLYLWFCVILMVDYIRHSFVFELFWYNTNKATKWSQSMFNFLHHCDCSLPYCATLEAWNWFVAGQHLNASHPRSPVWPNQKLILFSGS